MRIGSLTVHVVNEEQEPLQGRKVFCEFPLHFLGTWSEAYTDGDGEAPFEEVPAGPVRIIVDGDFQMQVRIREGGHTDVTACLSE